jgi:hypothetical protein
MTEFVGEIGRKLGERWVTFLVVPGLLYLAAATAAASLGQGNALGFASLGRRVGSWANSMAVRTTGGAVLILVGVLAGSLVAGLAATTLGRLTEMAWAARGRRRPARWVTAWRRARARRAKRIADDPSSTEAQVQAAMARADRICLVEPSRPTWVGASSEPTV